MRRFVKITVKQKIISAVQSLDDDASIDHAIERLYLLQKVEVGIQQADSGDVLDHDKFMKQVEDAQEDGSLPTLVGVAS